MNSTRTDEHLRGLKMFAKLFWRNDFDLFIICGHWGTNIRPFGKTFSTRLLKCNLRVQKNLRAFWKNLSESSGNERKVFVVMKIFASRIVKTALNVIRGTFWRETFFRKNYNFYLSFSDIQCKFSASVWKLCGRVVRTALYVSIGKF